MKKVYYQYDPKVRIYRRVYPTFGKRLVSYLFRLSYSIVIGALFFIVFMLVFDTTSVKDLTVENARLQSQYRVLSKRIDDALTVLSDIEKRDDNLYRVILEASPVSEEMRSSSITAANRYGELDDMDNAQLVISTSQKVDLLEKKLYVQSRSFNEILELSREQENRLAALPAIQPVSNKDLKRTASGYGYRSDPVYHVTKFHQGMDFACDTGTPVYATGGGTVTFAKWETGYGNMIVIDHGFGYVTRYAHLSKIIVKKGQKVSRGEEIGAVGSTGKSTGPHLHYEVLVNNKNVNPVNYYFMDIDAQQYDEMIQLAENQGKVFD